MPDELIEVDDARDLVLAQVRPLEAEEAALRRALGRVIAEDAVSRDPVPAFDNSAMDGFALRAASTAGARAESPVALGLTGEAAGGAPPRRPVAAGEAIAVSTGAAVPAGADAVVRVEDTAPPRTASRCARGWTSARTSAARGRTLPPERR